MIIALMSPCIAQAASVPAEGKNISAFSPDESRISEISAKERESLLALLKQWQDELEKIKLQLKLQWVQHEQSQGELRVIKIQFAQMDASPSTAAASAPEPAPKLRLASALSSTPTPSAISLAKPEPASALALTMTLTLASAPSSTPASSAIPSAKTGTQENRTKPPIVAKQPVVQQDYPYLQYGLLAALGLVVILALWLRQLYYTKIKSRIEIKSQQDAEPIRKPAGDLAAQNMAISPVVKFPSKAPSSQDKITPAPAVVAPSKASLNIAAPPQEIKEEVNEEDLLLEEAMLYASHGRPSKAVEMLLDIVKRHPSKAEAWSLLLSTYSSLAKGDEFEKIAREFLKHHKDSPLWRGIQALGRTFDQNNPMYADNSSTSAPSLPENMAMRQPIGDVLMEMGILSEQDLQNCLNDFDSKKDGRFGGYLVKRKVITLAQLDQALLQQQGVGNEAKPEVPSLQDLEYIVADFEPKRDGSIGEFLASRNASTPEQLRQLMRRQSS